MMITREQARARAEDLRWMAETGETAAGAARRLGLAYTTLEKWASNNVPDVWVRLRDHERHRLAGAA